MLVVTALVWDFMLHPVKVNNTLTVKCSSSKRKGTSTCKGFIWRESPQKELLHQEIKTLLYILY